MLSKKVKLIASTLCILAIISVLGGCSNKNLVVKENSQVKETEIKEPVVKDITISFAGDVTMGNYIGSSGYGTFDHEFEKQNKNYKYFFEKVKHIFEEDDITIVNLEGPLTTSTKGNTGKKFAFKGHPSYVNILKEGSVEAVSIANNHSQDYYEQGIEDTKYILDDHDIKYSGMGEESIVEVDGIKIGLLAYNGWDENYHEEFLDGIKNDIQELKKEANLVAIYYHWGDERSNYPSKTQKDFAHFSIDNGADLVMGSHPHVLQGLESYKNKDGEDKIIAYSLGNFSFGGNKNPSDKDTMIYQQTFRFEDGKLISSDEPNIIPCSISSEKYRNNYQPTPLEGEEAKRVLNRIKTYSKNL